MQILLSSNDRHSLQSAYHKLPNTHAKSHQVSGLKLSLAFYIKGHHSPYKLESVSSPGLNLLPAWQLLFSAVFASSPENFFRCLRAGPVIYPAARRENLK